MSDTLGATVSISLKFLNPLKRDADWLREELAAKGLRSNFKIAGGALASADLDVIRYVSRIRTFAYLDQARTYPFFDLRLKDESGETTRCITSHPRDILPELGVLGFREDSFRVADVGAPELDVCRVSDPIEGEFAQVDRDTFRSRYFGPVGELKMSEFGRFNNDPAFIARARDLGFFAYVGSYTGYLQIELDKPG